jgi:hypothetical protein
MRRQRTGSRKDAMVLHGKKRTGGCAGDPNDGLLERLVVRENPWHLDIESTYLSG